MGIKLTHNNAVLANVAITITGAALTTGAIVGAVVAGSALAIVALSIGAAVAGVFTLYSIANTIVIAKRTDPTQYPEDAKYNTFINKRKMSWLMTFTQPIRELGLINIFVKAFRSCIYAAKD